VKVKGFVAGRAGCPDKTKTDGFHSNEPGPLGLHLAGTLYVSSLGRATSPPFAIFLVDRLAKRQTE
jgi:hypothetical protein